MSKSILPTNEQFPDVLKLSFRKAFCKDVRLLLFGVDVLGDNPFGFADLRSEEVVFQGKVFVPGGHLWHVHKGKAPHVILKDGGTDKTGVEDV